MWFPITFPMTDPSFSSEITIVHNTVIGGRGTDPNDASYRLGQAVNLQYAAYWGPGCDDPVEGIWCDVSNPPSLPTGNHKLIVADNIFRTNGSAVRYNLTEQYLPDPYNAIPSIYTNGSVAMTGNDTVTYGGYGHNIWGGHGHLISGNRFHDSTGGASIIGTSGGIIENNIFTQNGHGLIIGAIPAVTSPAFADLSVRHNTIVNNLGAGIIYNANSSAPYVGVPDIYNNVVAYNTASGIVAVGPLGNSSWGFIPVDFHLERNDVFGNTLKDLYRANDLFSFAGIANPEIATKNYAGTIKTSLDLSVNPGFVNLQGGDYSLTKGSPLVNKGVTTRSIPSSDFAKALRDSVPDIGAFEYVIIPK
jgi:parallel beta-helix repeat protein